MTDAIPSLTADFAAMRRAMVASQLRTNAVVDTRLLEAMGRIPREAFVPAGRHAIAYTDRAVPLGGGRVLNPPMTTARLIDAAGIGPKSRVLLVGAGTGYALAVLAEIAGEIIAVECDPVLAETARANVPSATVVLGPLESGAAEYAPYDAIVIDGAIETVPDAFVAQLLPDGRLTTAIFEKGVARLAAGRRGGTGFALADFADAEAAVLPGFTRPKEFVF